MSRWASSNPRCGTRASSESAGKQNAKRKALTGYCRGPVGQISTAFHDGDEIGPRMLGELRSTQA